MKHAARPSRNLGLLRRALPHRPSREEVTHVKFRTIATAVMSIALVILGSGIAEALPKIRPNW